MMTLIQQMVLRLLFELSKLANTYLLEKQTTEKVLKQFIVVFDELTAVLGINICKRKKKYWMKKLMH